MAGEKYGYKKKYYYSDPNLASWIDNIAIRSPTSADVALRRIGFTCRTLGISPKQLAASTPKHGYGLILKLVKQLHAEGKTPGYIKNCVVALKGFFEHNGKPIHQKIRIPRSSGLKPTKVQIEKVPTPEQFEKILDNASIEQKVRCVLMGFGGLRPETLGDFYATDGLRLMDLPDLKIDTKSKKAEFERTPAVIVCRPSLSKADFRYFSFMPAQGCEYITELLEQRMRAGETLTPESFLVTSMKYRGKRRTAYKGGPISTSKVTASIRKAIRKAGFDFRPYILRSYFDSRMMVADAAQLILRDYRVFFMGHKGDIEHRYSVNKEGISQETVEQMRSMYSRAAERFLVTKSTPNQAQEATRAGIRREWLELFTEMKSEEIDQLGDLAQYTPADIRKIIEKNSLQALGLNGNTQKVVPTSEGKKYIEDGWEYVKDLSKDEIIIRLPH
jgi:integrase